MCVCLFVCVCVWYVYVCYIDLNDRGILGGEMKDVVLGLNWYMHSSTRVTLNYIHSYLKAGGSANILMTRLQIAF